MNMCTYLGCIERQQFSQEQVEPNSATSFCGVNTLRAMEIDTDAEMRPTAACSGQACGPQLSGRGECNIQANQSTQKMHPGQACGPQLSGRGECNIQANQSTQKMHPGQSITFSTSQNQQYKPLSETCSTCHVCWREQHFTNGCEECGGFALTRPCPICNGRCGAIWTRVLEMSNEMKSAFWDGSCRLSQADQNAFMLRNWVGNDVDTLVDALSDLGRS